MSARSRRREQSGPMVPPEPGALGVPGAPPGEAQGEGLTGAIQRWRQRRQARRAHLLDTKVTARENLRDYRPWAGTDHGAPGGGG